MTGTPPALFWPTTCIVFYTSTISKQESTLQAANRNSGAEPPKRRLPWEAALGLGEAAVLDKRKDASKNTEITPVQVWCEARTSGTALSYQHFAFLWSTSYFWSNSHPLSANSWKQIFKDFRDQMTWGLCSKSNTAQNIYHGTPIMLS